MRISLIALLAVSGCAPIGATFCDLYDPVRFNAPTAAYVVQNDRAAAEQIDTHNSTHATLCEPRITLAEGRNP